MSASVYQKFLEALADTSVPLERAKEALHSLPPSKQRTILIRCVEALANNVLETWDYFEKVMPEPEAIIPDISDEDTRPFVPVQDE